MTAAEARRRPVVGALHVALTVVLATLAVLPLPVAGPALVVMLVLALPGSLLGAAVWGSLALMVAEGWLTVDWPWQPLFVLSWGLLAWGQARLFRAIAHNWRTYPVTAAPRA